MNTNTKSDYSKRYAAKTVATLKSGKEIQMKLVGTWIDLTAYYQGDDGNYWSHSTGASYGGPWVNRGPVLRNLRGETLGGLPLESLPDLSA